MKTSHWGVKTLIISLRLPRHLLVMMTLWKLAEFSTGTTIKLEIFFYRTR